MRNILIVIILSICVASCTFTFEGRGYYPPLERIPIEFDGVSATDKGSDGYYITLPKDSTRFTVTISSPTREPYEITGIEYDLDITTSEELFEFPAIPIAWDWGEVDRLENGSDDVIYSVRLDMNSSGKKRMMKVYINNRNYSGNTIIIAQQSWK